MRCTQARKEIDQQHFHESDSQPCQQGNGSLLLAHLRQCAECRAYAEELKEAGRLLRIIETPDFDEEFYRNMRSAVLREITREPQGFRGLSALSIWGQPRPATVVLLIAMLGMGVVLAYFHSGEELPSTVVDKRIDNKTIQTGEASGADATDNSDHLSGQQQRHKSTSREYPKKVRVAHHSAEVPRSPLSLRAAGRLKKEFPVTAIARANEQREATALAASASPLRIELQTSDPNVRIIWFTPVVRNK